MILRSSSIVRLLLMQVVSESCWISVEWVSDKERSHRSIAVREVNYRRIFSLFIGNHFLYHTFRLLLKISFYKQTGKNE